MWVTADSYIRQELLPNGHYEIKGAHIEYWDDTGFTADRDFTDDNTLAHGDYIFYREIK